MSFLEYSISIAEKAIARIELGYIDSGTEQYKEGEINRIDLLGVLDISEEHTKCIIINAILVKKFGYPAGKIVLEAEYKHTTEKMLHMGFNQQKLDMEYNGVVKGIKMPWCMASCLEGVLSRGKDPADIKAEDMAKIVGTVIWGSVYSLSVETKEFTIENKDKTTKKVTLSYLVTNNMNVVCNKHILDTMNKILVEFELAQNTQTLEGDVVEITLKNFSVEWFTSTFAQYMERLLFKLSVGTNYLYDPRVAQGQERLKTIIQIMGYSSGVYTSTKSLSTLNIKRSIEEGNSNILYMSKMDGDAGEDDDHSVLIEGYTDNDIWLLDSNGESYSKGLILVHMVNQSDRLVVAYGSPSSIYSVYAVHMVLDKGDYIETRTATAPETIQTVQGRVLKADTLINLSFEIMRGLSDEEALELSLNKSEYCALVMMYRFMELQVTPSLKMISLSVPDILHMVKKESVINKIAGLTISNMARLRGYNTVSYSPDKRSSEIMTLISQGMYPIWIFKRYTKNSGVRVEVGTYSMVCAGHDVKDFILYRLNGKIIEKVLIPISKTTSNYMYTFTQGGVEYTCDYVNTVSPFTSPSA